MSDLLFEVDDSVALLTLNRPEARNALSMEMRQLLKETLHEIESDPTVRCVLLRGAGEHFMAGGDIKGFQEALARPKGSGYWMLRIHDIQPVLFAMRRMGKPVVAQIAGAAAGAGVSLAAACDLIIAADDSFFTLAYSHLGVSPDWGASYHLPRAMGIKRAMQMALLGERIDARRMFDWGLVNYVVPARNLEEEALKLARRLAAGPTRAYGNAKRLLYESQQKELETQLEAEAQAFADSAKSPDFREGVEAFLGRRRPDFKGI